jgi:hypothetical protein
MTHKFTFEGRSRTIFTRTEDPFAPWYIRIKKDGADSWVNLGTHAKSTAEQNARDLLRASRNEKSEETREALRQRKKRTEATLGQVVEAFEEWPSGPSSSTRSDYLWALRSMVQTIYGKTPEWTTHPAAILDADFVFKYRTAIMRKLDEEEADDRDIQSAMRSGNSVIRQARALFGPELLQYYRIEAELELPDLAPFRTASPFKGVVKKDYQQPDDGLIARTFEELEKTRDTHPDRYKVCWLALGFGLRKGEIAAARTDWLVAVGGRIHLELRSVIQKNGTESPVTKNGQANPRIPISNGAWERLQRVKSWPGGHFIGGCKSYRIDDVFRETNEWLRSLGWETQKGIHELRAYAGCQVIMRDGLLAGSQWLRHERVETTQKFYGRYIQTKVSDVPLKIDGTAGSGETNLLILSQQVVATPLATLGKTEDFAQFPATSLATPAPCHKALLTPTKEAALVGTGDYASELQDTVNEGNMHTKSC